MTELMVDLMLRIRNYIDRLHDALSSATVMHHNSIMSPNRMQLGETVTSGTELSNTYINQNCLCIRSAIPLNPPNVVVVLKD